MQFTTVVAVFLIVVLTTVFGANDCGLGIVESGVNNTEKEIIVNKHNELRLLIAQGQVEGQPKGVNIKKIYWDDQLAQKAQEIADTCIFAHVKVEDDRWSWVGQNLFKSWQTHGTNYSDWANAIQDGWFSEYKNLIYPNSTTGVVGHYTQVVWDTTRYVGCGYTSWIPSGIERDKLYVCNYGPGGNYVGAAPYQTCDSSSSLVDL